MSQPPTIDPDEWANLEPWEDTIKIYRNGNLMYEGPVLQIEYTYDYLGIQVPTEGGKYSQ